MTIKKLEYCLNNFALGSKLVFETIQRDYPEIQQQRWGCLGNCTECLRQAFVLIDEKEIASAPTGEQLLAELQKRL